MNTTNNLVCCMANAIFVLGWILVTYLCYQEFKTEVYEAKEMYDEICSSNHTPTDADVLDSTHRAIASDNIAYIHLGQTDIMVQYNK